MFFNQIFRKIKFNGKPKNFIEKQVIHRFWKSPGRDRIPRGYFTKTNVLIKIKDPQCQTDVPLSKKHKFENFNEIIGLKAIRKLIIEKNLKIMFI